MRVLIVEHDSALSEFLLDGLQEDNHVVTLVNDGRSALELAADYEFDVIVLDWALPGLNGREVSHRLWKSGNNTPVLILTQGDAVTDVEKSLDAGTTGDFLTKPFSFAEFLARIRTLGRRHHTPTQLKKLEVGDLTLDPNTHQVFRGGRKIHLTPTEYRLLELLMRQPGNVVQRRAIIEGIWGLDAEVEENTLDAFIRLIRSKIDQDNKPRLLQTVRGFGYRLQMRSEE